MLSIFHPPYFSVVEVCLYFVKAHQWWWQDVPTDALLTWLFRQYLIQSWKHVVIGSWEKMVNGVKIEPHIHDIRQQSTCILCFSIGTSLYLMMSEITDLLVALSPLPTSPMTQESQFDESKRKADMHNQEESPSCIPISQQGKKRELNQRNQVKPLGLLPILQGNNDDLQKYVAECNDGK